MLTIDSLIGIVCLSATFFGLGYSIGKSHRDK